VAKSRRGFTLIELLVVIAIIAILAAMLFPVFARARESARKIQCLSNVKNIATAFQMYLTDYDRFPPGEHNTQAVDYFVNCAGADCWGTRMAFDANPYLRWPVVLDEYVKNRDVWRCPSAKMTSGARYIIFGTNWLATYMNNESIWKPRAADTFIPCNGTFPTGWGGVITDSLTQGRAGTEGRYGHGSLSGDSFEQTIGTTEYNAKDLKTSQIDDPSWYLVAADAGKDPMLVTSDMFAFPDVCMDRSGCTADWSNCSWSQACGNGYGSERFYKDPTIRKPWARHLGGSNLGFADGHAAWMAADAILANTPGGGGGVPILTRDQAKIKGLCCLCEWPAP
jgi:prepilin-type N-terminal cleavage/methylation domain-containing protein/prepilin-type processing-associated H-X9-DG protein